MAVDVRLNTPEVWRSVVGYQQRKRNPDYHWRDNRDVPQYLDEWYDEEHYDVRGPYTDESAARIQAGRDASARSKGGSATTPSGRAPVYRVTLVTVERSSLAWELCGVRDADGGKWETVS
ncbi:hypothetical protein ACFW08_05700 [Streptomyces sp. NPDC058960]|uniref:hypothetical protein n=1 Tax=Streptomyces sp. NPDC058960 TaxID=3346679 RepID=UPI0036B7647B